MARLNRVAASAWARVRALSTNADIRANKEQLFSGHLPDPDFALFEFLRPQDGLVVDAGANRGHCSLAVLARTPRLRVVAFEPIESLRKPLDWIRRQYPRRFYYHLCALGAVNETRELIVPRAGKTQATTNASIRGSEFAKDYVQDRLEGELQAEFDQIELSAQTVQVRTLDSFDLDPLAIKIDVEGLEREVIEGARETIARSKPMLMIEMNNHMEFFPLLEAMGYRFYRFDPGRSRLVGIDDSVVYLNVICLHPDRRVIPNEWLA